MIQLSHIGEDLITAILSESRSAREVVLGSTSSRHWIFQPEIRISSSGPLIFDGAHKVDVSALDARNSLCVAIEAKLGLDRLSRNEFNKRFISKCGTSHNASRVTGSMISVLDRLLPDQISNEALTVQYESDSFRVSQEWILVVRRAVYAKWSASGTPNLSSKCKIVVFEDIIDAYGDKEAFNELVRALLSTDFYTSWFE